MKKVMEDRVLWSLAIRSYIVRTVQDTPPTAHAGGDIQLSVIENSFPESVLNIIKMIFLNF